LPISAKQPRKLVEKNPFARVAFWLQTFWDTSTAFVWMNPKRYIIAEDFWNKHLKRLAA